MRYFDNTRLSCFKECPRRYYLRHVRHWRKSGVSTALAFGLAWHDAMDQVWQYLADGRTQEKAWDAGMSAFLNTWEAEGLPSMQEMDPEQEARFSPRTPGIAGEMLAHYMDVRWKFIQAAELLSVERPFWVPLQPDNPNLLYIGRLDKLIRYEGRVNVIEHKTTALYRKDGPFRLDWLSSWSPNSQCDGYLHALNLLFPDEPGEVWVDGALVHKTVHNGFVIVPVTRMIAHIESWLYDTMSFIESIFQNEEKLLKSREGDPDICLTSFPKNTEACFGKYGPCVYVTVCKFVGNPETLSSPPEDFIEEKWEPFSILKLAGYGLEDEEEEPTRWSY